MSRPESITVSLVSHSPDHGDGTIREGDTVVFDVQPNEAGCITVYGSRDGVLLSAWALVLGDEDVVLGASPAWLASPGPLHCDVQVMQSIHGKVKVVAETTFEVAG